MESLKLKTLYKILYDIKNSENREYIKIMSQKSEFVKKRFCFYIEIPTSKYCDCETKILPFPLTLKEILEIYELYEYGERAYVKYKHVPYYIAQKIYCGIIKYPLKEYCTCMYCMKYKD